MRTGLAVAAIAIFARARTAHADESIEGTIYAANERPLAARTFPGSPDLKRAIVGLGVEWIDAPPRTRNGWTLRFGAAVEHQADCAWSQPTCPFPGGGGPREVDMVESLSELPQNHVEGGAHVRVGWLWKHVQLEGGVLAFSRTTPTFALGPKSQSTILPDVVARFGTRTIFLALGHGTYAAPTLLAPMFFVQGEVGFADRWATTFTAGTDPFSGLRHDRFDFAMRYQLTRNLGLGEGLVLSYARTSDGHPRLGGEARVEVAWSF